jgi:AraC-like DNA-binding protein
MLCQDFLPSPALQEYIKCYHIRHFLFSDVTSIPFKPYAARPEQTLAFYPRGRERVEYAASNKIIERPQSTIIGQYSERTNRHLEGLEFLTFIINFQPGALYRITGIPFHELTNTFIDGEAVFSKEIRQVNERLNSTDDYQEMIEIVEKFLMGLVHDIKRDRHPIDSVTNYLLEHPHNTSLLDLSRKSFLCTRQFERKFKERMGINPKTFIRIARLNKAFRLKYHHPLQDWLSIALICGYHDYQHLVKDFQVFAGVTPAAYYLEDTKSPERLFGLRDSSL